jgi:flagellar biosynthesis/type III secretory pathway chaperone
MFIEINKEWLLNKKKKSIFNYGYSPPEPETAVEDIANIIKKEIEYLKERRSTFKNSTELAKYGKKISFIFLDAEIERMKALLEILETQQNEIKMSYILEGEAMANSGQYDIDESYDESKF